jgi:hypothetical protein
MATKKKAVKKTAKSKKNKVLEIEGTVVAGKPTKLKKGEIEGQIVLPK